MVTKKQSQSIPTAVGDFPGVVSFEPCAAPITKKRSLKTDDEKPKFSLRHEDKRVFVYGMEACLHHGDGSIPRRLNSFERYDADPDYLNQMKVQWLRLFSSYRGQGDAIQPTGSITVPISVYNYRDETTGENTILNNLRAMICDKVHIMEDYDGCQLKVKIASKRLTIFPESVPALFHYAFDHRTLKSRGDNFDASGNVVTADIGFLTTDLNLSINLQYQRQQAYTEGTVGMGRIAQSIVDALSQNGHEVDITQVDVGMRLLAGSELGAPKHIMIAGAYPVDVSSVYDPMIVDLAHAICNAIRNRYKTKIKLIVLSGGGAYHLYKLIQSELGIPVVICPDAHVANVVGAMTRMRIEAAKITPSPTLLFSMDVGNGTVMGVSSETLRLAA